MDRNKTKVKLRARRHRRVRTGVEGAPERPRLCVFRSHKHIYASWLKDTAQSLRPRPVKLAYKKIDLIKFCRS